MSILNSGVGPYGGQWVSGVGPLGGRGAAGFTANGFAGAIGEGPFGGRGAIGIGPGGGVGALGEGPGGRKGGLLYIPTVGLVAGGINPANGNRGGVLITADGVEARGLFNGQPLSFSA